MSEEPKSNTAPPVNEGYDRHEINARVIAPLGLGIVLGLVALVFAIQYYYDVNHEEEVYVRVLEPVSSDLRNLRAHEDEQLHSYRYIDRERGKVRLPIERAMELLAAEYAAGAVQYPTTPYPVKTEQETAAASAGVTK